MFRFPDSALPLNLRRTGWATTACLAVAAVVAGCGGGERVEEFQPTQVVAFGDEYSAFDTAGVSVGGGTLKGLHYSVNQTVLSEVGFCDNSTPTCSTASGSPTLLTIPDGDHFVETSTPTFTWLGGSVPQTVLETGFGLVRDLATDTTVSYPAVKRDFKRTYMCTPVWSSYSGNWVQTLAHQFGSGLTFGGDYCSQDSGNAISYAAWGAKVAEVVTQVNNHLAQLQKGTLVTMFAGQNDVFEVFSNTGLTDQEGIDAMTVRGRALAVAVNDIASTGAKVVVVTLPNLSLSPFVVESPRVAHMQALVRAFNHALTLALNNDGRKIGLVDAYVAFGSSAADDEDFACDPALVKKPDGSATSGDQEKLLYCTSESLKTNGSSKLWADAKHLGPAGHVTLAGYAFSRVRQNF